MTYDIGDRVRLSASFTDDITGEPADPTDVTCRVKPIKEAAADYGLMQSPSTIVRDGIGEYHLDIDITSPGTWTYRWAGTGALVVAGENTFFVRFSGV